MSATTPIAELRERLDRLAAALFIKIDDTPGVPIDRKLTFSRTAEPLPKSRLTKGAYYIGVCRNANIARWDGEKFWYWRVKWAHRFMEDIRHREDDAVFDVFDAWATVRPDEVAEIPIPHDMQGTRNKTTGREPE